MQVIGRYTVASPFAAGGMASVHLGRAQGPMGFARTVAVKRLLPALASDPAFTARFLDEARLAARVRHVNVVPTLDVVAEDDELLVVMEYVEGDSVAHLVKLLGERQQRVPIAFAAAICAQALHGLHAAHQARDKNGELLGIVHRDVSPQNVLVGIDGVARVLDFGIAKAASRASTTEDGQIKGKTAYMAPEQLHHAAVDRRTDIFAASVMLWELLCARRLFFADSPGETMARVLTGPIDPPELHTPGLTPALSAVCLRGLSRDPAGRFGTAEEMALAIEEALPMPRAKEIGVWVGAIARTTLDARTELVHLVEQSSHRMPVAAQVSESTLARVIDEAERRRLQAEMPTDAGSGQTPALPPPVSSRREWVSAAPRGEESTELSTVQSTSHPVKTRPSTSRGPLWLAVAGGTALVIALLVVVFTLRSRAPAPVEARGGDAAPAAVELVPSASVATPASAEAPPSASASAVIVPVEGSVPAPSASASVKKPPPRRPPRNRCEFPFVIDANGQRHIKPECAQ